jgi:hypothetical protein
MTFPRITLVRVIVAVLAVWLLIGLVALVLFHGGDSVPGEGHGDRKGGIAEHVGR